LKHTQSSLPEVNFSDEGPVRHLHLGTQWIQGSMLMDAPTVLVHEYIQRMMAWLLFADLNALPKMQAMQLGLGAASLTKYCHKVLRMKTCAVELNPQVVHACRGWFKLPPDNSRIQVVLADAAVEIQKAGWRGTVDALQVDLYDHDAAAPVLDSEAFYADCRRVLTPEGCMTVNLFGRSSSYARSVEKIAAAFGRDAVWAFKPTRAGNTVVLARASQAPAKRAALAANAEIIQTQWGMPARQWARILKPIEQ
jgi:spermidine synthase